jgi:hypothetical protein
MTTPAAVNPYPNAPVPVGATNVDEWDDVGNPDAFRLFTGKVWEFSEYSVYVQGTQLADVTLDEVVIKTKLHSDDDLSPRGGSGIDRGRERRGSGGAMTNRPVVLHLVRNQSG